MPPFSYRIHVLIPRNILPHTEGTPHSLNVHGSSVALSISRGSGNRLDNLTLVHGGFATHEQAKVQSAATRFALMRAGLISHVPINFGTGQSSLSLAAGFIDAVRDKSGVALRPDIHGIDIMDEAHGPYSLINMHADGHVSRPLDRFLQDLHDGLNEIVYRPESLDRLDLAVEVFMFAELEPTPRTRFLGLVTVLEILATREQRSPAAIAFVDRALEALKEVGTTLDKEEFDSLQGGLRELKRRSIGKSVMNLAQGIDPAQVSGFKAPNIRVFLRHCYNLRSQLLHDGTVTDTDSIPQLVGNLTFLIRHLIITRLNELAPAP